MKLKVIEKKSYCGVLQPNWWDLESIQRDSQPSKEPCGYYNQFFFFFLEVLTINPAATEKLVEKHRATDDRDRSLAETNPDQTCIPSPM